LQFVDRDGNVVKIELGGMDYVKKMDMPEMALLVRSLLGKFPQIGKTSRKFGGSALGVFIHGPTGAQIALNPGIFASNDQGVRTLAHEIGHMVDWFDDKTLKRGNVGGRAISGLKYVKKTIPKFANIPMSEVLTAKDRGRLRRIAAKSVGGKPPKDDPGLADWRAAVAEKYKELLAGEISRRGLVSEATIRAELEALSEWWKPIPEGAPESFVKYRMSPEELYADFISVALNAPNEAKRRAPEFWTAWVQHLDKKPQLFAAFREIWEFQGGKLGLVRHRHDIIKKAYKSVEEMLLRDYEARQAEYKVFDDWWDRAKTQHWDIYHKPIELARRVKAAGHQLKWWEDPEALWDMHPFEDNSFYMWVSRVHEKIIKPMYEDGISQSDLGLILKYERVAIGDRSDLANSWGIDEKAAKEGMMVLRAADWGPEKFNNVRHYAKLYREMFWGLVKQGIDVEFFTPAMAEKLRQNKDIYATFGVAEKFLDADGYVPAGIRRQIGTMEEGVNPFVMMLYKAATMHKAFQWQRAKLATIRLLERYFPSEIRELEHKHVFDRNLGYTVKKYNDREKLGDREGVVSVLRRGQLYKYVVDENIAVMEDVIDPLRSGILYQAMNTFFRGFCYRVFITYNVPFQLAMSPVRDFGRSWVNLPSEVSRVRLLREYHKRWGESKDRMKSKMSPLVREMMAVGAFGTPFQTFHDGLFADQDGDALALIMRKLNLEKDQENKFQGWMKKHKALSSPIRATLAFFDYVKHRGQALETLPKVAAYSILTRDLGVPPMEAGEYVRNYVGVPAWHKKGKRAYLDGSVLPFITVAVKGLAADAKVSGMLLLPKKYAKAWHTKDRPTMLKTVNRPVGLGPLQGGGGRRGSDGRPKGKRAKDGRKSRSGWWYKHMRSTFSMRLLSKLAAAGIFGEALKRMYDAIYDYDADHYHTIPLGWHWEDEDNATRFAHHLADDVPADATVVGWRMPIDESSRILAGVEGYLIDAALSKAGYEVREDSQGVLSKALEFGGGQIPGLNPLIGQSVNWYKFASGGTPRDDFRGTDILTRDQQKAPMTTEAFSEMLAWTWDDTGLGNYVRYDTETDTTLEAFVKNTPVAGSLLGKFLRFYPANPTADLSNVIRKKESAEAWIKVKMDGYDPKIKELRGQYARLTQVSEEELGRIEGGDMVGRRMYLEQYFGPKSPYAIRWNALQRMAELAKYDTTKIDKKKMEQHFEALKVFLEDVK